VDTILNRVHVAEPQKRDGKARPPCIPAAVHQKRLQKLEEKAKKQVRLCMCLMPIHYYKI
jgi:nucleolar GTP-binding protein